MVSPTISTTQAYVDNFSRLCLHADRGDRRYQASARRIASGLGQRIGSQPLLLTATSSAKVAICWTQAVGSRYSRNISRNRCFSIFPVAPNGMLSTNATSSGVHHLAILPS